MYQDWYMFRQPYVDFHSNKHKNQCIIENTIYIENIIVSLKFRQSFKIFREQLETIHRLFKFKDSKFPQVYQKRTRRIRIILDDWLTL